MYQIYATIALSLAILRTLLQYVFGHVKDGSLTENQLCIKERKMFGDVTSKLIGSVLIKQKIHWIHGRPESHRKSGHVCQDTDDISHVVYVLSSM